VKLRRFVYNLVNTQDWIDDSDRKYCPFISCHTIDIKIEDLKQVIKDCQWNIRRNSYHLLICDGFHEENVTVRFLQLFIFWWRDLKEDRTGRFTSPWIVLGENMFNMHRRRGQSFHIPLYVLLLLLLVLEMVDILSVHCPVFPVFWCCLEYDNQQYYASLDVICFEVYWKLHFFRLKFHITLASSSWTSISPKHTCNSMCICNLRTPHNVTNCLKWILLLNKQTNKHLLFMINTILRPIYLCG
jgi:hypothetical protein